MTQINSLNPPYDPLALSKIIACLSMSYEENLTRMLSFPHHWLTAQDHTKRIIGGICLTNCEATPQSLLLQDFFRHNKDKNAWIASHLFCWPLKNLNEEYVIDTPNLLYTNLYKKLFKFCATKDIRAVWIVGPLSHYQCAASGGLLLFERELFFRSQGTDYVAALLSVSHKNLLAVIQAQVSGFSARLIMH